jgi:hypothetical protein
MSSDEMIAEIILNIERIFGDNGFGETDREYKWLLETYGVTESEDNSWIDIIDVEAFEELDPDSQDEAEIIRFLNDPIAVKDFLANLVRKYRSSAAVYRG